MSIFRQKVYFKVFWKLIWLLVAWFLLDGRTSSSQVGRPRRTEPYWRQVVDTPPSPYGRFPWLATNICRGNNGHSLGLPWLTTQLKWVWFLLLEDAETRGFPQSSQLLTKLWLCDHDQGMLEWGINEPKNALRIFVTILSLHHGKPLEHSESS